MSNVLLYVTCFLFTLLGNLLVIAVSLRKRYISPFSIAIAHLALCDLLVGTRALTEIKLVNNNQVWDGNVTSCKFAKGSMALTFFSACQTMSLIALERRNKIVTPLSKPWSYSNVLTSIAIIWVCSVFFSSPYIVWLSIDEQGNCRTMYVLPVSIQIYIVILFTVKYAVPLAIMSGCYLHIILILSKRPSNHDSQVSAKSTVIDLKIQSTTRIIISLIFTLVAFTFMTVPLPSYFIYHKLFLTTEKRKKSIEITDVLKLSHILHSAVNPLIYLSFNKTFRKRSLSTLKWMFGQTNHRIEPRSNTTYNNTNTERRTKYSNFDTVGKTSLIKNQQTTGIVNTYSEKIMTHQN